jgi:hypothetical protein
VKRSSFVALVLLAALGLSACASEDEVLTVNGDVLLDQAQMDDLLQEFADDDEWLTTQQGRGQGTDTLAGNAMVVPVLNNYVIGDVLREELDRLADDESVDFDREADDEVVGLGLLAQGFNIPVEAADPAAPTEEELRAAVESYIPERYREVMIDFATQAAAFERYLGAAVEAGEIEAEADLNEVRRDFLQRILDEADVDVSSRYGEWDAATNQIIPPEGPVSPPTTALVAPAG